MRVRQSVVSSFCVWLVKREVLTADPVAKLERPPHHREPPKQVPGSSIMGALVQAAKAASDNEWTNYFRPRTGWIV